MKYRIIFDGPPGPEGGRFVEVENGEGKSVNAGEWSIEGALHVLTIDVSNAISANSKELRETIRNREQAELTALAELDEARADIKRLKIAGEAMRRALVCFNIRRHPRTSRSHDESERVVDAWDLARTATSRPTPGALVTAVDFAGGPDRAAVVTMQDGKIVSVGEHPAAPGAAKEV